MILMLWALNALHYSIQRVVFLISKVVFGLVFEIWDHEAGFDSNRRVERSGECGSDVRTNRPSLLLNLSGSFVFA